MATTVLLHKNFLTGTLDTQFATDLAMLSPEHRAALDKFISNLLSDNEHEGRNKESWMDSAGRFTPGAESYKAANAWHIHCGPRVTYPGSKMTGPHLPRNFEGLCTKEAIHYFKNAKGVAIFGFSQNHIPFLNGRSMQAGMSHPFSKTLTTRFQNFVLPGNFGKKVYVMSLSTPHEGKIIHGKIIQRKIKSDDDES